MKLYRPVLAAAAACAVFTGSFAVAAAETAAPEGAAASDPGRDLAKLLENEEPEVDPALEEAAQNVPATPAAPATLADIQPLTEAPDLVSGKGKQGWFKEPHIEKYNVYSESMGRYIPVAVLPARDSDGNPVANAPTLYMLNGAGGAEQNADWIYAGEANEYFHTKSVNVVVPMEGAFSYYVDWLADGETLKKKSNYFKGAQKWTTFLGAELAPAIEAKLGANDKRAVVGFSMSGTSALLLAEHYPGMFDAVGSFSGCAATSTPLPWAFASLTVNRAAKSPNYISVTPAHAWGPIGSPYNRYNDALVNAAKLRGSALYISNGSGLAADQDMFGYRTNVRGQNSAAAFQGSAATVFEGGIIEAATNACAHDLRAKLKSLNIPAHYEFRNTGTHSWPIWLDDMRRSWNTVIGPTLLGDEFTPDDDLPSSDSWGSSN